MKIIGNENEKTILKELGSRIRQQRLAINITQAELAERCGISLSTEMRIENGDDSKMSSYIKILSALNMSGNFDMLIHEAQPDYKSLFEEKPRQQRAKTKKPKSSLAWTWGEDREE